MDSTPKTPFNVLTYRDEDSLARALTATVAEIFPTVDWVRSDPAMNVLIFARRFPSGDTDAAGCAERLFRKPDPDAVEAAGRLQPVPLSPNLPVFTDDRAPTAALTHKIVWRMLLGEPTR